MPEAKKQNSACHFCDHAARRSGRYKVAEQVACSLENCRKVFCSRRACIAKLRGPGVPQTIEEFRHWKSMIERGDMFFVCPHCVDQAECQGPQCKKRGQVKQQQQQQQQHPSPKAGADRPLATKRSFGSLSELTGRSHPPIEERVVALTIPYVGDLNGLESYEASIQQYIGTAPFDYHRKRRKSGSFEVIAPIPIRLQPLAGQFQGLTIQ